MGFTVLRYSPAGAWSGSGTGSGGGGAIPSTAGLMIAATRPEVKNFSTVAATGATGMNAQVPHRFPNGLGRRVMLCHDNFGVGWDTPTTALWGASPVSSAYDNPAGNAVTFACSLSEPDGSVFYQGHVAWVRHTDGTVTDYTATLPTSVTVSGGDSVDFVVDLGTSRAPGTWLTEHSYRSCAPGGSFWVHQSGPLSAARNEVASSSAGELDRSMQMLTVVTGKSTVAAAWSSSIRHIDAPPAALRHPTIGVGDSLLAGWAYGWGVNFQNDTIPYVNVARGTEPGSSWLARDARAAFRRSQIYALGGFTRTVMQYLTNDATNLSQTFTTWKARRDTIVSQSKALGAASVAVGTLPPNTGSTDSWTTLANQYLLLRANGASSSNARGDNEALRQQYNADCRAGAAYGTVTPQAWVNPQGFIAVDGGGANEVMDVSGHIADLSGAPIGKWYVDPSGNPTTGEGLHPGDPSGLGASRWAAAIPDDFFDATKG